LGHTKIERPIHGTYGIEQADALTAVCVGTGKTCLRDWDAQFPAVFRKNCYPSLVGSRKSHQ